MILPSASGVSRKFPGSHTNKLDLGHQKDLLCTLLPKLGIKFIVQRNDFNHNLYNVSSPLESRKYLLSKKCLQYQKSFGKLDIYSLNQDAAKKIELTNNVGFIYSDNLDEIDLFLSNIGKINNYEKKHVSSVHINSYNAPIVSNYSFNEDLPRKNCRTVISHREDSPIKHIIRISNLCNDMFLVFNERYSQNWKIFVKNNRLSGEESEKLYINNYHAVINGFANGWFFDVSKLIDTYNVDTRDFEIVLSHSHQNKVNIMYLISLLNIVFSLIVLLFLYIQKKHLLTKVN